MSQYIPDLCERFPEGMNGVDLTPLYFGGEVDWSRALREDDYECEDDDDEEDDDCCYEFKTERKFEVGKEYREVGVFGGVTYYKVEEIDRENGKILMSEIWEDVDGTGTRPSQWHDLKEDDKGNERAFDYYSNLLETEIWIYA